MKKTVIVGRNEKGNSLIKLDQRHLGKINFTPERANLVGE